MIWAFPFFFYLNLVVGYLFYPIDVIHPSIDYSSEAVDVGMQLGKAFFIGMFINLPIFGILTYFIMNSILRKYRETMLTYVYKKWNL